MLNNTKNKRQYIRLMIIAAFVAITALIGSSQAFAECDVEYWEDLDYHSYNFKDTLYPWGSSTECMDYYFYPDTGSLSFSVSNINTAEGSHAFVAIKPRLNYDWTAQRNSTSSTVSVSTTVTYTEEWVAHVEYYAGGDWDEPYPQISHDALDINLKVTSTTSPAVLQIYAAQDPQTELTFEFKVENVGNDDIPTNSTWYADIALYADATVSPINYSSHNVQDSWELSLGGIFQDEMAWLNVTNNFMSSGSHFNVVAVVDPPPNYYPGSPSDNALKLADIYWDQSIEGFVHYNDWDFWMGPPSPMMTNEYAAGITVKAYNHTTGYYIGEDVTDEEGNFEITASQQSLPIGQTYDIYAYLDESGVYTVRDDVTNNSAKIGYEDLQVMTAPTILEPQGTHNDHVFNSGLNGRNMLAAAKQFLADNEITYNPPQVNFRVTSEVAPLSFNHNYVASSRTIYLPEQYSSNYYYNRIVQRQIAEMVLDDLVGGIDAGSAQYPGLDQETDITWAFVKGWDAFFATLYPTLDINSASTDQYYNPNGYLSDNIETNSWESTQVGDKIEGVIARILYDLYDNSPLETYDNPPAHFNELLNLSFANIYNQFDIENPVNSHDLAGLFTYVAFQDQPQPWCNLMENAQFDMAFLTSQIGCIPTSVFERGDASLLPTDFAVGQNYPNPFNSMTKLEFDIPRNGDVKVEIFDILGRRVYTELLEQVSAGSYSYSIDFDNLSGRHMASGIYLMKVSFGQETATKKMNYLK